MKVRCHRVIECQKICGKCGERRNVRTTTRAIVIRLRLIHSCALDRMALIGTRCSLLMNQRTPTLKVTAQRNTAHTRRKEHYNGSQYNGRGK